MLRCRMRNTSCSEHKLSWSPPSANSLQSLAMLLTRFNLSIRSRTTFQTWQSVPSTNFGAKNVLASPDSQYDDDEDDGKDGTDNISSISLWLSLPSLWLEVVSAPSFCFLFDDAAANITTGFSIMTRTIAINCARSYNLFLKCWHRIRCFLFMTTHFRLWYCMILLFCITWSTWVSVVAYGIYSTWFSTAVFAFRKLFHSLQLQKDLTFRQTSHIPCHVLMYAKHDY